jgi:hypothetical protein
LHQAALLRVSGHGRLLEGVEVRLDDGERRE